MKAMRILRKHHLVVNPSTGSSPTRFTFRGHRALTQDSFRGHRALTQDSFRGRRALTQDSFRGHRALTQDSFRGHCALTQDSFRGHCALTQDSFRGHRALTQDSFRGHRALTQDSFRGHRALTQDSFRGHRALTQDTFRGHCTLTQDSFRGHRALTQDSFRSRRALTQDSFRGHRALTQDSFRGHRALSQDSFNSYCVSYRFGTLTLQARRSHCVLRLFHTHSVGLNSYQKCSLYTSSLLVLKHAPGCGLFHGVTCRKKVPGEKRDTREFSLSAKQIVDASPPAVQSYMKLSRVDRPIGTWLVYLPCTWSIGLAAAPGHLPDLTMLALFGVGAFLMRGAGCTINDMWDKEIDRQVRRTRDRPLASGQLTNLQALSFLGLQLSAALAILLTFDMNSIILGASSMALVVTYPLMKRVTFWPHVFLGLTLNWGVLLAWSVLQGAAQWEVCLPLYVAGVMQTVIYDTIYAHRDKEDDLQIGVKSAALYLGDQAKTWLSGFGAVMVGSLALTGIAASQTWPYYLGVAAVGGHFTHQIYSVNLEDEEDCADKFRSNRNLGLLLFMAIVTGNLLKPNKDDEQTTSADERSNQ